MTIFLRMPTEKNKEIKLLATCRAARNGRHEHCVFDVDTRDFSDVPGIPFNYWVSASIRNKFKFFAPFEPSAGVVRVGTQTSNDERFVRSWWEN